MALVAQPGQVAEDVLTTKTTRLYVVKLKLFGRFTPGAANNAVESDVSTARVPLKLIPERGQWCTVRVNPPLVAFQSAGLEGPALRVVTAPFCAWNRIPLQDAVISATAAVAAIYDATTHQPARLSHHNLGEHAALWDLYHSLEGLFYVPAHPPGIFTVAVDAFG